MFSSFLFLSVLYSVLIDLKSSIRIDHFVIVG